MKKLESVLSCAMHPRATAMQLTACTRSEQAPADKSLLKRNNICTSIVKGT